MKLIVSFLLTLVVIVVVALFAGANDVPVVVDFLLFDVKWPLAVALFVAFLAGFLLSSLLYLPSWLAGASERLRLKRQVEAQRKELDNFRKSALSEQD
jgi:uncharacterized membrane protein YciS (DUF1049 family)